MGLDKGLAIADSTAKPGDYGVRAPMARQKLEKAGSDGSQHRPVCQAIVRLRSCAKNGFRTNGKPPPLASRPDSMITLNCPRIRVALSASCTVHVGHVNVGDQDFNSAVAGKFF